MAQRKRLHRTRSVAEGVVAGFEAVVWHAWQEVVNVVEANVAGEPLQHAGQAEVGRAVE